MLKYVGVQRQASKTKIIMSGTMKEKDHLMVGKCFTDQGLHTQFSTAAWPAIREEGVNKILIQRSPAAPSLTIIDHQ